MKALWIVGSVCVLTLSVVACGDDDSGDGGGTGGTATGGTATGGSGTGGSETGGSGTGGSGTGGAGTGGSASCLPPAECDASGDGVCENATDCEFVLSGEARSVASTCGQSCNTKPAAEKGPCAVECINAELGMSSECSACYAALVGCTFDNCLTACAADPSSCTCVECQVDNDCISDFEACSGLELVPAGGAGGGGP